MLLWVPMPKAGAHILLLCILIIRPFPPYISARYSSRSDGPTGMKDTSLRARRSGMVCFYFSLSLLERNSGKLGKTGKISNGKMHWKGLNEAVWRSTSPKLPPLGGLLTQPYGITDTSFKVYMWQERLNFNWTKGLVYRLYSFDTTAVYVLGSQRTLCHASHPLTPTVKWLKKNFLKQMPLTSKISAWSRPIVPQNVGIFVLLHPKSLLLSLASQISHKSPLSAERRTPAPILFHYKQAEPWNQCERLILKLP